MNRSRNSEYDINLYMFKKNPQPKPSANIKSSERRNLLSSICKDYDIEKEKLLKEDELDLLPAIIKQASYQSIQGQKGTIFFDTDEKPLWFQPRDHPLYPTIYTLWKSAYILPIILTNDPTIERLLNFANLMLPGCIPPFDPRSIKGRLVGVASYKSPTVIKAIGHCSLDMTQYDDVEERRGTAVTIIHSFDDELFRLYDKPTEVPLKVNYIKPGHLSAVHENRDLAYLAIEGDKDEGSQDETIVQERREEDENESSLRTEDIDNFFIRAFIQSVKQSKMDFPITASKFMSDHVLKNFPRMDAKYCNIKKSSWKKTAKYLKALEKLNYLTLKGKGDDVNVTSITIKPEIVANFVPHKTMDEKKAEATPSKKSLEKKLLVLSLYRPNNRSRLIFDKLDKDFSKFYTKQELKEILNEYIKVLSLANKNNPKLIDLNSSLASLTGITAELVARDKLHDSFLNKFSPNFCVLKPGEVFSNSIRVLKGEPPKIKILTQNVLGRKKTTSVLNFETFFIRPQELAEDLKNLCSGSTAVNPSVHNPNVTEVMVQGPHGPAIVEYLKTKGVPIAFIDFEDKSKGRKKK